MRWPARPRSRNRNLARLTFSETSNRLMQIRSLLKKVEARAALRDFLKAALWVSAFAAFFFLLLGAIDHRFDLSIKTRLASLSALFLSAIVWIALGPARKARNRGAMWAALLVERQAA